MNKGKEICLRKFEKIIKSANKSYEEFLSKCDDLLCFVEPMIKIYNNSARVVVQEADGFVLSWEGKNIYGKTTIFNTSIYDIVREYENKKDVLTAEDLRQISI